ncbi:MAG: hypothetical protein BGN89_15490 [Alphaproteobacteria bacterium 64-6]|nr:MAG: hypothetical protein BGN89_15490 [Alphaproteobacteria bacterium 64-6]
MNSPLRYPAKAKRERGALVSQALAEAVVPRRRARALELLIARGVASGLQSVRLSAIRWPSIAPGAVALEWMRV